MSVGGRGVEVKDREAAAVLTGGGNNCLFLLWWILNRLTDPPPHLSLTPFAFIFSPRWPSRCQAWTWVVEGQRQPLWANQEPQRLVGPRRHRPLPARPSALSCGSDEKRLQRMIGGIMAIKIKKTTRHPPPQHKQRTAGVVWLPLPNLTHLHHGSFKKKNKTRWHHSGWNGKKKKDWQLSFPVFAHPSASFLISFSRRCLKKETKNSRIDNKKKLLDQ